MKLLQSKSALKNFSTPWSLLLQANNTADPQARDAQAALVERYRRAVYRYLLGATHDPEQAEELFQEFAFRFVRGDFRNVRPQAGRFRDYLRASLSHLINDARRERRKTPHAVDEKLVAPDGASAQVGEEDQFLASWRVELVNHAWAALRAENSTQHEVLLFSVNNSHCTSVDAAEQLSRQLGKAITPANVRVITHRARERFAELLLDELEAGLYQPTPQELYEELRVLNFLRVCSSAWEKRHGGG